MSPCTKRLQRRTRSAAPFSGVLFHCCALASLIQIIGPTAAPAANPADVFKNLRRLISLTTLSSRRVIRKTRCRAQGLGNASCGEPRAACRVEQMRARKIGDEPDAIARAAIHAIADERCDLLPVE